VTIRAQTSESPDERIDQIAGRLADLRTRALELSSRASRATAHAVETRSSTHVTCNHAEQAELMGTALAQVEHELDGLRDAMLTRGVIEQAKGMLMLQRHCDADAAFAALVELSQNSHRKLVEVARALVDAWAAGDDVAT
jgi:hypothetical protein